MTTPDVSALVAEFGARLDDFGWVTALHVAGSLATGDHQSATSDVDLVAVTTSVVAPSQLAELRSLHETVPPNLRLGCTYVPQQLLDVRSRKHPTWTHGKLVDRWLSGITRAELVRFGYSVFGPQPNELWPSMSPDDVRLAVTDELAGYWTWAGRRPWLWLSADHVDLSVTTMLRARHALRTGELVTKSAVLAPPLPIGVPGRLVEAAAARRVGTYAPVRQRTALNALAALRLTRRTVVDARKGQRSTSRG